MQLLLSAQFSSWNQHCNDPIKRVIVGGIENICRDLGITMIGEGIETEGEHRALLDLGITLQQGYFFARPGFEALPAPAFA